MDKITPQDLITNLTNHLLQVATRPSKKKIVFLNNHNDKSQQATTHI